MAPRELEQDWQLECSEIKQRGARVLSTGRWTDCWFEVGADRARRPAHKLLLGMASPVFEAMFYGPLAEGSEPIAVPDIEPHAFDIMLSYIYCDNIDVNSCKVAVEVYYVANKYMLPHLQAVCAAYISSNLTPESVCIAYEFARDVGEEELVNECLKIMKDETREVLSASSFVEAREETVQQLFSLKKLNIRSELELLAAAERWAHARTSSDAEAEGSATAASDSETPCAKEDAPERQPALRGAVNNIRFLTLTGQEFAKHPNVTSLLTDSESLAILMNITSKDTPVPMPSCFSTFRTSRNQIYDKSRPEATLEIEVDISNLTTFYSDTFYVRDLPWRVKIVRDSNSNLLSTSIECNSARRRDSDWSCETKAELHLLSFLPNRPSRSRIFNLLFTKKNYIRYFKSFKWNVFTNPAKGYVRDNKIVLKVILNTRCSQQP